MNGKGDNLRKGSNLKAYRDNYDRIFRKSNVKPIIPDDDTEGLSNDMTDEEYTFSSKNLLKFVRNLSDLNK